MIRYIAAIAIIMIIIITFIIIGLPIFNENKTGANNILVTDRTNAEKRNDKKLNGEVQKRILKCLGLADANIVEMRPRFKIPFIPTPTELFEVDYSFKQIQIQVFFTSDGAFWGVQSVKTMDDPWRYDDATIEKLLIKASRRYDGLPPYNESLMLGEFLNNASKMYDFTSCGEFQIYHIVANSEKAQKDGVIIINIWGIDNPLNLPDDLPEGRRNRVRATFDIKGKYLYSDNIA